MERLKKKLSKTSIRINETYKFLIDSPLFSLYPHGDSNLALDGDRITYNTQIQLSKIIIQMMVKSIVH